MEISRYYFETLGVSPEATKDEIKKAFRRLVKQNHPDLFPEEHKQLQEMKMIQINEAYARLTESIDQIEGSGRLKFYRKIRQFLEEDTKFRDFFEGETTEIPEFYVDIMKKDLGPLWEYLPEGAIYHDQNAYLKSEMEKRKKKVLTA